MSDFRSSEIPNGSDLISRKTAIDLIEYRFMKLALSEFGTGSFREGLADGYARVISDLKMLPSARSEQKTGEWVLDGKGFYKCTSCGETWPYWWAPVTPLDQMYKELRHCPKCGVKMTIKKLGKTEGEENA